MKNNVLKTLSNNWLFKILAFLLAFTLWVIVYNLEDPTKTTTMTVNVSVINKESVESLNKYVEFKGDSAKVTFSVTGKRSVLEKLEESDFSAVADMEYMVVSDDESSGRVPIAVKCTANTKEAVTLNYTTKYMEVSLEKLMSKPFLVEPRAIGKVAEGYVLGNLSITAPNTLRISGPESIVSKVHSVAAIIDVSGMSANMTDSVLPILYDAEGKEVDSTRLSLSTTMVNISANILSTKEVPVVVKPSGTPAEGYVVTSVTSKPETILIKGSAATLNSISKIVIPSELVSVEDATDNVTTQIDITEYLPYGVEPVDNEETTISVTVELSKLRSKVFSVLTDNIIVTGLPTGVSKSFVHSNVAVTIYGLEEDLAALSGTAITGTIDVTNLSEGEHQVPLQLDIDGEKYTYETVLVSVIIGDVTTEVEGPPTSESE